jgi:CheY-like chemotaxis protein
MGNAEVLSGAAESGSVKREKAIGDILRAAKRGEELTKRLLGFSRKQLLERQAIDLGSWLTGIHSLLQRTLGEAIELETFATAELWDCSTDPGQLDNAILNLAINARDAMPSGGKLTIEANNITIEKTDVAGETDLMPGSYVMLAVSDNGCGMSAETREKAFEPFFTTKETEKGTGLGLSMVLGFAKQSGGHVDICSAPERGTTVKVFLPRTAMNGEAIVSTDPTVLPESEGETILVVEDDSDVRELTVTLLDTLGYNVLEAMDGPSALRVLENGVGFDLLLTDVILPGGLSGPEIAAKATESRPDIKVLFMTGYAKGAITHHGTLDDGVNLLRKPFHIAELATKVRAILT